MSARQPAPAARTHAADLPALPAVLPPASPYLTAAEERENKRTRQIADEQLHAYWMRRKAFLCIPADSDWHWSRYADVVESLASASPIWDSVLQDAIERDIEAAASSAHPEGDPDEYAFSLRGLD